MEIGISQYIEKHKEKRYIWLFTSLFVLLTISPFLAVSQFGRVMTNALICVSLFACSAIISPKRTSLIVAGIVVFVLFVLSQIGTIGSELTTHLTTRIAALLFYIYTLVVISIDVGEGESVDANKLCGAVCIYLLIGLFFSQIFQILIAINPAHFVTSSGATLTSASHNRLELGVNLVYFSFVTLTTMGYGDILPATLASRMLSALEAVVGQIYLAVLVARLVSLYTMRAFEKEQKEKAMDSKESQIVRAVDE